MISYSSVDPETVAQARATRTNANGTPAAVLTAEGGEPVRCCLSYAAPGEPLLLVSVDLGLPTTSPYALVNPVFLHLEQGCTLGTRSTYPPDWRGRRQVIRGYDERGWIVAADEHDGSFPERSIETLLDHPGVERVMSTNVQYGCFMLWASRPATAQPAPS